MRVGYEKFFPFRVSLGFGLFPINGILNQYIQLAKQPVSFSSSPDTFNLYPTATYSATSFGLDLRYHVASSGFFINLNWSNFYFANTFNGELRNDTQNQTVAGSAVTGGANIIQPMIGLAVGYEFSFQNGLFFNGMLGAAYPLATLSSINLGGTAAQAAPLQSGGTASFDAAKASFQNSLDAAIAAYRRLLPVIPMLTIQIGWIF